LQHLTTVLRAPDDVVLAGIDDIAICFIKCHASIDSTHLYNMQSAAAYPHG
jgi:hypothetical protein